MSFKSSEINSCSWTINTVLESPFYSSSCCRPTCFPSIVRPKHRFWQLILRIFLHSPEMNRSLFFSLHLFWMTKTINYFLRYLVFGERIFPWFNIDPIPFNGNDTWWRVSRFSSFWICFCLRSTCKIFLYSVLTHILRADLREFLFRCCSNSAQTYFIHEKFWSRSEC